MRTADVRITEVDTRQIVMFTPDRLSNFDFCMTSIESDFKCH